VVVDTEARDTVDRCDRQRELLSGYHLLNAEVSGHQRLSAVRSRVVGRVDRQLRAA